MLFQRDGNTATIILPVVPQPGDELSAHHLVEELYEIPEFLHALPALQLFQSELQKLLGESLPPALLP